MVLRKKHNYFKMKQWNNLDTYKHFPSQRQVYRTPWKLFHKVFRESNQLSKSYPSLYFRPLSLPPVLWLTISIVTYLLKVLFNSFQGIPRWPRIEKRNRVGILKLLHRFVEKYFCAFSGLHDTVLIKTQVWVFLYLPVGRSRKVLLNYYVDIVSFEVHVWSGSRHPCS